MPWLSSVTSHGYCIPLALSVTADEKANPTRAEIFVLLVAACPEPRTVTGTQQILKYFLHE